MTPPPTTSPYASLAARLSPDSRILLDESMSRHTTLRVGGPADCYAEPASEEDLACLVRYAQELHQPLFILGRGSNLLVRDGGIRGLVVCLSQPAFTGLEIHSPCLRCGAGVRLKAVAVEARRHGLAGLEFLEGIPGNLGGALRMNAGAMGASLFERVRRLRAMAPSGQILERDVADVPVQYRRCPFLETHIALSAVLQGQPANPDDIQERMASFSRKRWDSQPAAPSAGCIFKNPASIPAGKLVEQLGLKGTRIGGAAISDLHGNFIVNEGSATARDVLALIDLMQKRAFSERGISLEPEVQIVGEEAL